MIRTQVYLTDEQVRTIKLRSQQEQKPEAQVIREIVDNGLKTTTKQTETAGHALLRLANIHGKGPADLSQRLDDHLYGTKD